MKYIHKLSKLPQELSFGGKAASLDILLRNGLPVPEGHAVAAEAFENGALCAEAETELAELIKVLPQKYRYAVRSSAVGEDGAEDSFAGAYDTVLDIDADMIPQAVKKVAASADNVRSDVYSQSRGAQKGGIGVVIQRFISPEFAGVLFTADPVTAGTGYMSGSYVRGVGEALVSGEKCDGSFRINAVKYNYDGASELAKYAGRLYKNAAKAVRIFGCPQDIEWAVSGGKLYILQARPITTLYHNDREKFLINDSLCGDYLLSKTNVGEIFLRPVSPATYGMICGITDFLGIPLISNVCGQLYCNISGVCSVLASFGISKERAFSMVSDIAGGIPDSADIPLFPYDKNILLKKFGSIITHSPSKRKSGRLRGTAPDIIDRTGMDIIGEIHNITSPQELYSFWDDRCTPYMTYALSAIVTGLSVKPLLFTRKKLTAVCGAQLADRLLSCRSGDNAPESLGMLLAVEDVIGGRMTKAEYTARYGHRHADEMELSMPYPYEDPDFPDNVIREYKESGADVLQMKADHEKRSREAEEEFLRQYPDKAKWLKKLLDKYSAAVCGRESIRSSALRLFCVIREYLLKAGQLTNLGDDIFMLYMDEARALLTGKKDVADIIPERRKNYEEQLKMPNFPSIIRGRFVPEEYAPDSPQTEGESMIVGTAGSCGIAEGYVRVLTSFDGADTVQSGEILVVPAANIGWVRVFPRIAALVTDVGAPLSHAVIVARELGIPAVVNCGNASLTLKTGDRVRVDGASGKVYILDK
ncbi:MAG: PEP/pyruvate-binding domain-containing protein [Oscillospiraceae bacterium]